jgi:hypothetical protein
MMTRILAFALTLTILNPSAAAAAKSWWVAAFPPPGSAQAQIIRAQAMALRPLVPVADNAPVAEKADAARRFINGHTLHKIDDQFYAHWADMPYLLDRVRNHARPRVPYRAEPPHTECATRSALLYHLLAAMGVRTRAVVVYPNADDDRSHTFLEIFDPADSSWHVQDPDMNAHWEDHDGARADTRRLVGEGILHDDFMPCTGDGPCGWFARIEKVVDYFALAAIIDPAADHVRLIVNPQRYDRGRLFAFAQEGQQYCALYPDRVCAYQVIDTAD